MCLLGELLSIRVARIIPPGFRMDPLLLQLHHAPEHHTASSKEWPEWFYDRRREFPQTEETHIAMCPVSR